MYPWRSFTCSPSRTRRPHASSAATPRRSSLRFSQLLAGATTPTRSPSRRRRGLRTGPRSSRVTPSDQEARHGMLLEEDRPIDPEPAELRLGHARPVDDALREDPAEDRRELVAVGGPEDDLDAGHVRQSVDDEVAIRGHRVEARPREQLGHGLAGQVALEEAHEPLVARLVPTEGAARRRGLVAA